MHVDDHRGDGRVQRTAGRGDAGSLGGQLARLTDTLDGDDITRAIDAVVHTAAAALPGVEHASITQSEPAGARTRVASSDTARRIDQLQYDSGEGPFLDALGPGRGAQPHQQPSGGLRGRDPGSSVRCSPGTRPWRWWRRTGWSSCSRRWRRATRSGRPRAC